MPDRAGNADQTRSHSDVACLFLLLLSALPVTAVSVTLSHVLFLINWLLFFLFLNQPKIVATVHFVVVQKNLTVVHS